MGLSLYVTQSLINDRGNLQCKRHAFVNYNNYFLVESGTGDEDMLVIYVTNIAQVAYVPNVIMTFNANDDL